jgi:hypothetical protein
MQNIIIALTVIISTILGLVFLVTLPWAVWLCARRHKRIMLVLILLYILMIRVMHFISLSDNNYSDISHGLFGNWNGFIFEVCLAAAFCLQIYVVGTHLHSVKKSRNLDK